MAHLWPTEAAMNHTRRQLLKAVAVSPVIVEIVGCQAPLAPVGGFPPTDPNAPLAIDVHTHVFNGSDLQINAFLRLVYRSNPDIAALLEDLVWDLAPDATAELAALREVATTGMHFAQDTFTQAYGRHTEKSYRNAI